MRAYPRVCGATDGTEIIAHQMQGLSPRVRGNLRRENRPAKSPRPIPACAGQPAKHDGARITDGAYPRVCGATRRLCGPIGWFGGLSPRVRGNLT